MTIAAAAPGRWHRVARRHRITPAAIVALLWIARYWASFGLHLRSPPRWAGWFDQDRYVSSAAAFARGDLSPAAHWYPPAYSLLAAPFVAITPGDPFFLPDLALYLLACFGFAQAMARLGIARPPAIAIFVLATLVGDSTAAQWLIPWNTVPTAALTWWLVALVAQAGAVGSGPPPRDRTMAVIGVIAGVLPAVRPTEAIVSAIALATLAIMLVAHRRLRLRGAAIAVGCALAAIAPFALLHLAIDGPAPSRYAIEAARQGFAFADLPWKAYVLLVTAQPWYPGATAMIERLPWLLVGGAGLAVAAWHGSASQRRSLALILAIAIPYALLFLAYTDLQPPGLWEFGNAHYFTWLFPLAGAGCWLWLRALGRAGERAAAVAALLVVLLPACIRPLPVRVGDETPARLLLFRGSTGRAWADAYFAPSRIVDDQGMLPNVNRFHQLPDGNGERAIAVTRLFASHPRRFDPGEPPPFAIAELPYARYAVRWSVGLPCWIARAACALPR